MLSMCLWEKKWKTTTQRQVRQEQDNELVQDLSTCGMQYVYVNIIPQDTRIDYLIPPNKSTWQHG
jgi:hypothetical protein